MSCVCMFARGRRQGTVGLCASHWSKRSALFIARANPRKADQGETAAAPTFGGREVLRLAHMALRALLVVLIGSNIAYTANVTRIIPRNGYALAFGDELSSACLRGGKLDAASSADVEALREGFTLSAWIRYRDVSEALNRRVVTLGRQGDASFLQPFNSREGRFCGRTLFAPRRFLDDQGSGWHHYAATWLRTSGDLVLYVDGFRVHADVACAGTDWLSDDPYLLLGVHCYAEGLGEEAGRAECLSDTAFDGAIDEVALIAGALTDGEVKARFNNTLSAALAEDVALLYDFDDNATALATPDIIANLGHAGPNYDLLLGRVRGEGLDRGAEFSEAVDHENWALIAPARVPVVDEAAGTLPKVGTDSTPTVVVVVPNASLALPWPFVASSLAAPAEGEREVFTAAFEESGAPTPVHLVALEPPAGPRSTLFTSIAGSTGQVLVIRVVGSSSTGHDVAASLRRLPQSGALFTAASAQREPTDVPSNARAVQTVGDELDRFLYFWPATAAADVEVDLEYALSLAVDGVNASTSVVVQLALRAVVPVPSAVAPTGTLAAVEDDDDGIWVPLAATASAGTSPAPVGFVITGLPSKGKLIVPHPNGSLSEAKAASFSPHVAGSQAIVQYATSVTAVSSFWGTAPDAAFHPISVLGPPDCSVFGDCAQGSSWGQDTSVPPPVGARVVYPAGEPRPLPATVVATTAGSVTIELLPMFKDAGTVPCRIPVGSARRYPEDCAAASGAEVLTVPRAAVGPWTSNAWAPARRRAVAAAGVVQGAGAFGETYAFAINYTELTSASTTEFLAISIPTAVYVVMVEVGMPRGSGTVRGVDVKNAVGTWVTIYDEPPAVGRGRDTSRQRLYARWTADGLCRVHFQANELRLRLDTRGADDLGLDCAPNLPQRRRTRTLPWCSPRTPPPPLPSGSLIDYVKVTGTRDLPPGALPDGVSRVLYVSDEDESGDDAFHFAATDCPSDPRRLSASARVEVSIRARNDAPLAEARDVSVLAWDSVNIFLNATDEEDGTHLGVNVTAIPSYGRLQSAAGLPLSKPGPVTSGPDDETVHVRYFAENIPELAYAYNGLGAFAAVVSLDYEVSDASGKRAERRVYITVVKAPAIALTAMTAAWAVTVLVFAVAVVGLAVLCLVRRLHQAKGSAAHGAATAPEEVIIISDAGEDLDDEMALIMARFLVDLGHLRLRAVIANLRPAMARARLIRGTLDQLGLQSVPVGVGTDGGSSSHADTFSATASQYLTPEDSLRAGDIEPGRALIHRSLEAAAPSSVTLLLISSLKDAALFLRDNTPLCVEKIRRVVIMGGVDTALTEETGVLRPDSAHNNMFDLDAATYFYLACQQHGIPLTVVTRHAAYAAPVQREIYDLLAQSGSPIGWRLRKTQRDTIERLWQRACAPPGSAARTGLPDRCDKTWFSETFCKGRAGDRDADDMIWDLVACFNMYDVLALIACAPALADVVFQPRKVKVDGVTHEVIGWTKEEPNIAIDQDVPALVKRGVMRGVSASLHLHDRSRIVLVVYDCFSEPSEWAALLMLRALIELNVVTCHAVLVFEQRRLPEPGALGSHRPPRAELLRLLGLEGTGVMVRDYDAASVGTTAELESLVEVFSRIPNGGARLVAAHWPLLLARFAWEYQRLFREKMELVVSVGECMAAPRGEDTDLHGSEDDLPGPLPRKEASDAPSRPGITPKAGTSTPLSALQRCERLVSTTLKIEGHASSRGDGGRSGPGHGRHLPAASNNTSSARLGTPQAGPSCVPSSSLATSTRLEEGGVHITGDVCSAMPHRSTASEQLRRTCVHLSVPVILLSQDTVSSLAMPRGVIDQMKHIGGPAGQAFAATIQQATESLWKRLWQSEASGRTTAASCTPLGSSTGSSGRACAVPMASVPEPPPISTTKRDHSRPADIVLPPDADTLEKALPVKSDSRRALEPLAAEVTPSWFVEHFCGNHAVFSPQASFPPATADAESFIWPRVTRIRVAGATLLLAASARVSRHFFQTVGMVTEHSARHRSLVARADRADELRDVMATLLIKATLLNSSEFWDDPAAPAAEPEEPAGPRAGPGAGGAREHVYHGRQPIVAGCGPLDLSDSMPSSLLLPVEGGDARVRPSPSPPAASATLPSSSGTRSRQRTGSQVLTSSRGGMSSGHPSVVLTRSSISGEHQVHTSPMPSAPPSARRRRGNFRRSRVAPHSPKGAGTSDAPATPMALPLVRSMAATDVKRMRQFAMSSQDEQERVEAMLRAAARRATKFGGNPEADADLIARRVARHSFGSAHPSEQQQDGQWRRRRRSSPSPPPSSTNRSRRNSIFGSLNLVGMLPQPRQTSNANAIVRRRLSPTQLRPQRQSL